MHRWFIILSILLVGCTPSTILNICEPTSKSIQIRSRGFDQVKVEGTLNVTLHTGSKKPNIILKNAGCDVRVEQIGSEVIIHRNASPNIRPVEVVIMVPTLSRFEFDGYGTVIGKNIHSNLLDLSIKNPHKTVLSGRINLRNLTVSGPGYVEINGVVSNHLRVRMFGNPHVNLRGNTRLAYLDIEGKGVFSLKSISSYYLTLKARSNVSFELAGTVNTLDVELFGNSQFHGRYLKAVRAFVKTHQHSLAEVSALNRQHTLASDASDIYFYDIPELKADFMAYNGAVLDMRDWHEQETEEYTDYNK